MDGITGDFLIVYGFKTILTIYGYICIIYNKCNRYINNISQRCSSVCQVKILDKKSYPHKL